MLVTIISDASVCHATHAAGYGFWAVSQRGRHGGSGSFKQTLRGSFSAESLAIVNALFITLRLGIAQKGDRIIFQTDAKYAIDVYTGIARKVKDPVVLKARDEFRKLVADHELTFEFRHVRGHTTVADQRSRAQRNCDRRAKEGMQKARVAAAAARGQARAEK